jgi:hypothetical protein
MRGGTTRSIASLLQGFNDTYDTLSRVQKNWQLAKVNQAEPEFAGVESAPQGPDKAMRLPGVDGAPEESIKVSGEVGKLKPISTLLGERVDPANKDQVGRVRQLKVADVLDRFEPGKGAAMRRDIRRDDMESERYAREKKLGARQDADYDAGKAYEDGKPAFMANTIFNQQQSQYAEQVKQWKAGGGKGPTPVRPSYGVAEELTDTATMLNYDAQNKRLNWSEVQKFAGRVDAMRKEGYEQALSAAQQGAPLQAVADLFNKSGKEKFNVADVASDQVVKRPDGTPTRQIKLKDGTVIDTASGLATIGKLNEQLAGFYKAEENKRGNNADRRAGAQLGLSQAAGTRAQAEFDAGASGRTLAKQMDDLRLAAVGNDPAKAEAAKTKLVEVAAVNAIGKGKTPAQYKIEMNEVATALGKPTGAPDLITGREAVNRDIAKEAQFFTWMKEQGITDTNEGLAKWMAGAGNAAPAGNLLQQAQDAVARGADKAKVNERLKAQGLPPIP